VTHNNRLRDEDGSLGYFLRAINPLAERLGPTLFQLPPNFKKDMDRLQAFLAALPRRGPAAMEFRHPSWFDDEVYEAMKARGVALVAVDENEDEGVGSPLVPTATWGYLRLRRVSYDEAMLRTWAERILNEAWSDAYVFLKHEDGSPAGPAAATQLSRILEEIRKT
jgi:uncharacterized protein YecE (DUF72 family)